MSNCVAQASPQPARPVLQRSRRGKGTPYVADVVERARVLVEGTSLPERVIARRVGVGVATVHGWKVARGWRRPADVPLATRKVGMGRANFTRRCRDALRRLEGVALREVARLEADRPLDPVALARAKALVAAIAGARRPSRNAAP